MKNVQIYKLNIEKILNYFTPLTTSKLAPLSINTCVRLTFPVLTAS